MYAQLEIYVMIDFAPYFDNESGRHVFNCLLQTWINEYSRHKSIFITKRKHKNDSNEIELDVVNEINILGSAIFVQDCNSILQTRRIFSWSMSDFYLYTALSSRLKRSFKGEHYIYFHNLLIHKVTNVFSITISY